jgi:APA family basic amino acid/polyamine antiporter
LASPPAPTSGAEFIRAIGVGRATAMVVGTIIGASIFVQPSLVSGAVGSTAAVLLVWTFAGALTLIGSLVTAELSSAYPKTGGVYVFLKEAYAPWLAYLWGWAMFWVMHSGIIAVIASVFARYLGHFFPLGDAGAKAAAVGAIVVLSAINIVGVRQASALQTFFTAIKLLAVAAVVVLGVWFVATTADVTADVTPDVTPGFSATAFVSAMIAGLFAYGGWHMVTYAAEETQNPTRTIPRALTIGTLVVTVAYIAINAAYLAVLPLERVVASTRVAADFADAVLGSGGANALSALVVVSTLGGLTGIILAGPRVYLAMANDGLLFRWAGAVHEKYRTPHVALGLQAVWSSVLVLTGTYRALFTRVVYTEWIFFALMAASLFLLRQRPGYQPAYRVTGYQLLCAVFVLSSMAIVVHHLISEPRDGAIGLGIVLAGLPVYWLWTRRKPATADSSLHSE